MTLIIIVLFIRLHATVHNHELVTSDRTAGFYWQLADFEQSFWSIAPSLIIFTQSLILHFCYICFSVHRNSRLKKSNETHQYADIYLLLNCSTCFRRPSRPSSGVHKTVVTASGTDHTIWRASFFKRDICCTIRLHSFCTVCSWCF